MWNGYLPHKHLLFIQIIYMVLLLSLVVFGKIAFKKSQQVLSKQSGLEVCPGIQFTDFFSFYPVLMAVTKGIEAVSQPC